MRWIHSSWILAQFWCNRTFCQFVLSTHSVGLFDSDFLRLEFFRSAFKLSHNWVLRRSIGPFCVIVGKLKKKPHFPSPKQRPFELTVFRNTRLTITWVLFSVRMALALLLVVCTFCEWAQTLKPINWLIRVLLPELGTPRMLTRRSRESWGETSPAGNRNWCFAWFDHEEQPVRLNSL